jgi:hypothetical protein
MIAPILADVVWPALAIMARSYTWWGIASGLVVEYLALRWIGSVNWKKAVLAVITVNAATSLIGYVAIPLLTFAWEFVLSYTVYQVVRVGTFNPFGWISTVIVIGAITGFPEYLLLTKAFKIQFRVKRAWLWWWIANSLSVLIAFITVLIWPVNL